MRYVFLSDVHGRIGRLRRALADIRGRDAGRIIFLGDIGNDGCYDLLMEVGAVGIFGNWEVSGWPRLSGQHQAYVRGLPAVLKEADFLAAHAVPYMPDGVRSPLDLGRSIPASGRGWRAIFPYLSEDPEARWRALGELETQGCAVLFHGHTHRQAGWWLDARNRLRPLPAHGPLALAEMGGDAGRFLVGVGSVGVPDPGPGVEYTLYDSEARVIEWIRMAPAGEDE